MTQTWNRRRVLWSAPLTLAGTYAAALSWSCAPPGAPPSAAAQQQGPAAGAGKAPVTSSSKRQPVVFLGHGSPMNAIEDNAWTRGFVALGQQLRAATPRAIVSVSAHWYTRGTWVTGDEHPKTIHDFGGFPQALFDQQYPAPGSPDVARRTAALVGKDADALRLDWGLDHGTWTVLKHLVPEANIPVVQLSIDGTLPLPRHIALGERLRALRDEGVLVIGSGNITHNLRDAMNRMRTGDVGGVDWAQRFDRDAARALGEGDTTFLGRALDSDDGKRSHPTPDHYIPLLYVAGAAERDEPVRFVNEGFDLGSLSMRSVVIG